MIPAPFEYQRASSLDDALTALASGDAKVLAGGMSLLPLMKLRLANPGRLVDIGGLTELKGIHQRDDGWLAIGALTTYAELLESPARNYGLLRDALPDIGDIQVRNRGTVGGAVSHADPASDLPACLLALEAQLVLRSRAGERTVPIDGFLQGAFVTDIAPDEILTEVRLPGPRDDAGSAYVSLQNPASGYAIAGCAAVVFRGPNGINEANVALTGVGDVAYRARAVESALAGSDGSAAAIAAAAEHATDGQTVNGDIHADRDYRARMAVIHTRRAIESAIARVSA